MCNPIILDWLKQFLLNFFFRGVGRSLSHTNTHKRIKDTRNRIKLKNYTENTNNKHTLRQLTDVGRSWFFLANTLQKCDSTKKEKKLSIFLKYLQQLRGKKSHITTHQLRVGFLHRRYCWCYVAFSCMRCCEIVVIMGVEKDFLFIYF